MVSLLVVVPRAIAARVVCVAAAAWQVVAECTAAGESVAAVAAVVMASADRAITVWAVKAEEPLRADVAVMVSMEAAGKAVAPTADTVIMASRADVASAVVNQAGASGVSAVIVDLVVGGKAADRAASAAVLAVANNLVASDLAANNLAASARSSASSVAGARSRRGLAEKMASDRASTGGNSALWAVAPELARVVLVPVVLAPTGLALEDRGLLGIVPDRTALARLPARAVPRVVPVAMKLPATVRAADRMAIVPLRPVRRLVADLTVAAPTGLAVVLAHVARKVADREPPRTRIATTTAATNNRVMFSSRWSAAEG